MFKLSSPYKPQGDQPEAIQKLAKGLRAGNRHQTVLGVTGSGKSVVGSTKVLLSSGGKYYHARIGSLDSAFSDIPDSPELTQYIPLENDLQTLAFDTKTGRVGMKNVAEISRHRYQGYLYDVFTSDGRQNIFTDSHNVFVLRAGVLDLVKSEDLKVGDYVPSPYSIAPLPSHSLSSIDLTEWVSDKNMYVTLEPGTTISGEFMPRDKMVRVKTGGAFPLSEYLLIKDFISSKAVTVGSKSKRARLPANIDVTRDFMRFLGLFIAEGHSASRFVTVSTGDASLVEEIKRGSQQLGLSVKKSKTRPYDYKLSGKTISHVLGSLCGFGSKRKHLPAFWPSLNNEMLGFLLSGIFAGDGCAEKNAVTLSSISHELLSDIQLALSRFSILSRIIQKRITYKGEVRFSWILSISGKENVSKFAKNVGFGLERKDDLVEALDKKNTKSNTNVEVMPIPAELFSGLMKKYGLFQRDVARELGVTRSLISFYLSSKRNPERKKAKNMTKYFIRVAKENNDHEAVLKLKHYLCLMEVFWTPIKSIKKEKSDTVVYDLSVPKIQTFLANGFFVHNTFTMANVIAEVNRPTMVMAPNKTLAAQLYMEFKEFFPENAVEYFVSYYDYYQPEAYVPSSDTFIDKDAQINEQIEQLRLSATRSLLERRDVIIVSSVSSIYGLGDPDEFKKMSLFLSTELKIKQKDLLKKLAELQYARNDVVLERGTFRVRGDLIDVWPGDLDHMAVRVELFDDEVEKISLIDPLTGKKNSEIKRYTLYPKSHYVTSRERVLGAIDTIKDELVDRMEHFYMSNRLLEAQRLKERVFYDLELFKEIGYCNGVENYSRHLSQSLPGNPPPTLFDYMPRDSLLIIDESHVTIPQIGGMFFGDRSRKENLVDYGFRLPSALDNRPLSFEEWEKKDIQRIYVSATPGMYEGEHSNQTVELVVRPTGLLDPEVEVRPQTSQVDDLLGEVKKVVAKNERVLATTLTKKMAEDLAEYLADNGIKVRYLHSDIDTVERMSILRDLRLGVFDVLVGINLLREGLDLPEVSLVAILDADKEGFLRSTSSLIQTIGRAARNQNGRAILYASSVTRSMKDAIDETSRRREKQKEFNLLHNITPTTISRKMNAEFSIGKKKDKTKDKAKESKVMSDFDMRTVSASNYEKTLIALEAQMKEFAEDLQFEDAIAVRKKIEDIRKKFEKK